MHASIATDQVFYYHVILIFIFIFLLHGAAFNASNLFIVNKELA